jgi:CheY-like chemotaxis protein
LLLGRFDGDLSSEQEKQVTYIQHSAADLSELVDDLLDLAKVEAGKIDVKPRHFEVREFFGALRGMLKPLLAGNSLDLVFDAAPGIPTLYMDEGKISQVLRNLISNALKFTRKGYIRVTAAQEENGWIVFRVADTGIGIAPEDQERIFEEFVQIESEMQSMVKGTGLGLPLSRRLTELLGGTLSVESAPGMGSTFTVRVPVRIGGTVQQPSPTPSAAEMATASILFVEDNRETRFVHQMAMKSSRYQTVFVSNIPEARETMKVMKPELIVLDRLIDERDCLFYIGELKSKGYAGPILVLSVVDDESAALAAGATKFIPKPVAPFTLLSTVQELIKGLPSKPILLVDDDEVTRYLLGGELAKLGYRVLEARGGREAISLIERETPDAVILDIAMPDMDGFEVLRQIRASASFRSLKVIVHSSREFTNEERATLSQAEAFLYPKRATRPEDASSGLIEVLHAAGIRA